MSCAMALLPPTLTFPVFTVRRHEPELVVPARPTPRECKLLSAIDDQVGLRYQMPGFHLYRQNSSMEGKDPVKVIREALAQALVYYYPFAGRLREASNGKLVVDCNEEGVLFVEADADVTFDDFVGDAICPHISCFDQELLHDVPGSSGIINCPLLLIQVTRLKCGGFLFAHRVNHNMTDAIGLSLFMQAMGEMARGALTPSIPPVWERHLLSARDPPSITCSHHAHDEHPDVPHDEPLSTNNLVQRSFFFGPNEILALRRLIPDKVQCSTFDILTACLWRCRTKAFGFSPDQDVRLVLVVDARSKFNPPLPLGYYGNAIGYPAALITAGELSKSPIENVVGLVKEAKAMVTEEFMKSMVDLLGTRDRVKLCPPFWLVSDLRLARLGDVDFGWGKAAHMAPAQVFDFMNFYIPSKNHKGEDGILVPFYLGTSVIEILFKEMDNLLNLKNETISSS